MKTKINISVIFAVTSALVFSFSDVSAQQQYKLTTSSHVLQVPVKASVVSNPSGLTVCEGNDTILFIAASGDAPITYQWLFNGNPIPFTDDTLHLTGLLLSQSGDYRCIATNGCGSDTSDIATLSVTTLMTVVAGVSVPVSCYHICDGEITANVTGGLAPYSYTWDTSPVQNTMTASGVCAGTYNVTVNDNSGCVANTFIVVSEPDTLILNPVITDASCTNNNGQIVSSPTGGNGSYMFNWSNGCLINSNSGLSAGTYSLTVTDIQGCSASEVYSIVQLSTNPVVKGLVSYSGGNFASGEISVLAFNEIDNPTGSMVYEFFNGVYNGPSGYEIQVAPDNYIIQAVLTNPASYPNVFDTYYNSIPLQNVTGWEDAEPLTLGCNDTLNINILMTENAAYIPGTVTFTGTIVYWDSGVKGITSGGAKEVGEPVEGAEVFIEQQPNDDPVANTSTDVNGVYTIPDIAEGYTYDMIVDIPGIPLISTYTDIFVVVGTQAVENLNFYVDTTQTIGGIFIDSLTGASQGLTELKFLKMYPNPATTFIFIEMDVKDKCNAEIFLSDCNGKRTGAVVKDNNVEGRRSYELPVGDLPAGNYTVSVRIGNSVIVRKFIIQ